MVRVETGVGGLDTILRGGLLPQRAYLVRGGPGQGKTTLGMHFLSATPTNESALFIGFQESGEQLKRNAANIGLDVSRVHFIDLSPDEQFFTQQERYDVFSAADVEQAPISESIVEAVERINPTRVFVDSLTQLRFLSADVFQYRKEVLSFLGFLKSRKATVLFTSEHSATTPDDDLQFLADGVLCLFGDELGQNIVVQKIRGSDFARGHHQARNGAKGLEVFPRPVPPKEELTDTRFKTLPTGVSKLDQLLGGGLESGTISMITGPSGAGKSTLAACIASCSARNVGHVSVYLFEEEASSFRFRANALSIEVGEPEGSGKLNIEQVEPLRYLADEFGAIVRRDVAENNTRLVVFDSTAGFQLTLGERSIKERLHALAKSLSRVNVSVLLINETTSLFGGDELTEKGISYLADNVIALNYVQESGDRSTVLTVMKKRLSDYDSRPYRYKIGPEALCIEDVYHHDGTP